jgi:uncharacterized protein involved in exopolysaccharide biosynthesis
LSYQEKGPLQLLYERLYVVVIVTAMALAAAWFVADRLTPIYRAQARCFMPTRTDMLSLTSEEGNLPDGPKLPTGLTEAQDSLLGILRAADLRQEVAAGIEGRSSAQLEKNADFALDKYNLITISIYDADPAMAQRIAQEYLRAFRGKLDETTKSGIRENAAVLDAAIASTTAEIGRVEQERQDFLRGQGTIDYGMEFELLAGQVKAYTQKLDELDANLESLRTGREETVRQLALLPAGDSASFIARGRSEVTNPVVEKLKEDLRLAEAELIRRKGLYQDDFYYVQEQYTLIEVIKGELAAQQERIDGSEEFGPHPLREQLEGRLVDRDLTISGTQAERAKYADLLVKVQTAFQKLPEYALKLDDFTAELNNLKSTLSNQRNRAAELDLYLMRNSSFLSVAEDPALPTKSWFPNMPLILLAAGLLGLVLSITLVVVMARAAQFRQEALW